MSFWTCGPFKEAADKLEYMVFKAEQIRIFMEVLEESKKVEEILKSGTPDEKLIASLLKLDIDKKLEILIGVPDGYEKKNDEVLGETILESLKGISKKET